ncbi:MAG TPA: sugar transferase [Longimicrobiales bacterium]
MKVEQETERPGQAEEYARRAWIRSVSPHAGEYDLFRLTDTLVVLLLVLGALVGRGVVHISGLRDFLAAEVTLKNLLVLAGFVLLWQEMSTMATRYVRQRGGAWPHRVTAVVLSCTIAAGLAVLILASGLSHALGIGTIAICWAASIPLVLLGRLGARSIAYGPRNVKQREVIIVGSGPRAHRIYQEIARDPNRGYRVVGFVDSDTQTVAADVGARLLGNLDQLEEILAHSTVDLVLITLPAKSRYEQIERAIETCERVGIESRYPADTFPGRISHHEFAWSGPLPTVAMKVVHDDARLAIKRVVDVILAGTLLILALPLIAVIVVAIRLSGPGPILFAQERYGFNRHVFRIYKFRTMVADAEQLQPGLEQLNEAAGPLFKIRKDPRITAVGRLLRRTSLDELPQLLNVLRGNMSLVGPRPLPLRDVRRFTQNTLLRRFSMRPGVTGLWQTSGRSNLKAEQWIMLDLLYIDHWSLRLDLLILLRTIPAVIRGHGAS